MRSTLAYILLCISAVVCHGMELGQTKESILAQHGPATEENHSRNTAVYRTGPWKVDLEFCGGVVCKLIFTRLGQLSEEEIQSILTQNAGGSNWRELSESGPKRIWQRDDFAQAECDRAKARAITFLQAPPEEEAPAPAALAQTESSPALESSAPATSNYAIERTAPPQPTPATALDKCISFFSQRPLVLIIPALMLLFVLLSQRASRKRKPEPTVPRRIVTPRSADTPPLSTSSAPREATLDSLESHDFELVLGEIFRRQGYAVEISGGVGADGGKDLTLRKEEKTLLVQGKHWSDWKVSEPSIRELYDTVIAESATCGIFVTTGRYTRDALAFAAGKPLRLLAREEFERLVGEVSAPNENLYDLNSWIDRFAAAARVVDPACPFCHGPMKLRRSLPGRPFWSCGTFPRCGGKRDGRVELLEALPS